MTTAWADEGVFGVLTEVAVTRYPALVPHGAADPRAWADEAGLAGIFSGLNVSVSLERRTAWFPFPSAAAAFAMFEATSGPVQRMRAGAEAQEPDGWSATRGEIIARWAALARPATVGVELPSTYGVATITSA